MKKTSLGKSFYTTSSPIYIQKELHKAFHLKYAEIVENNSDFPEMSLVTAIIICYEKDVEDVLIFLNRFDCEKN